MITCVAGVELAGLGIERHAPRVAQAHRPEFTAQFFSINWFAGEGGGVDEGVVAGHAKVAVQADVWVWRQVALSLIDVDSEDAAEVVLVNFLAVVVLVVAASLVAEAEVQVAVRPEVQVAAVVVVVFVKLCEHRHLGPAVNRRADPALELKTRQSVVQSVIAADRCEIGVKRVNVAVLFKLRM